MENLPWIVYSISLLGHLKVALVIVIVGLVCAIIANGFKSDGETGDSFKRYQARCLYYLKLCLIPLFFLVIIPSTNTSYKILAAYAGVSLLQNDQVQEVGNKSMKVLNKILDEYLDESTVTVHSVE